MNEDKKQKNYDPRFIWNGIFPDYEAANSTICNRTDIAILVQKEIAILNNYLRPSFSANSLNIPHRATNLPEFIASLMIGSVIDFGGGSGWTFYHIFNAVPNNLLHTCFVIDRDEVMDFFLMNTPEDRPFRYIKSSEAPKIDLLYSNSCLQYLQSNYEFINLINRSEPEYILLDDLMAVNCDDWFTLQTYRETKLAYRFIGLSKLSAELLKEGYSLEMSRPYQSTISGLLRDYDLTNFSEGLRMENSLTLLYRRVNS